MTIHINRFVDRLRSTESKNQRDLILSIHEARDLHADITKLLARLNELEQKIIQTTQSNSEIVKVEIQGGSF
jgi:hypothetical protein